MSVSIEVRNPAQSPHHSDQTQLLAAELGFPA
jgi:hypothetical protein